MAVVPIQSAKPAAEIQPARVGVLLVNLGTPDTADTRGVRVYLKEFLSDPRVIEDQGLKWKLLLNGIILRIRPARKARDYRKIWNAEQNESPLKTITRAQSEKLAAAIRKEQKVLHAIRLLIERAEDNNRDVLDILEETTDNGWNNQAWQG